MIKYRYILILCFILFCNLSFAQESSSPKHWGWEGGFTPGYVMTIDKSQKEWQKGKYNAAIHFQFNHSYLPSDSSAIAADYNYPTLGLGFKYHFNHGVTMHRDNDPDLIVDYISKMGNILTGYGTFSRPISRNQQWETDYSLSLGIAYSMNDYNPYTNVDNEMIGARWLIYAGLGLHVTYHFQPKWGIKAGVDYYHHSNGALRKPNKGANIIGPSIALIYTPYYKETIQEKQTWKPEAFNKYWFLNLTFGFGGKALHEEWAQSQEARKAGEFEYQQAHFNVYAAISGQVDLMYRYARRWASGVGLDMFYGTYADKVKQIDEKNGNTIKHSPWSWAFAFKHEAYYGNLSIHMGLGYYFYRHMGITSKKIEKRYYERIGLHYHFPKLGGLALGLNVKAHLGKADFTELSLSMPIKLKI